MQSETLKPRWKTALTRALAFLKKHYLPISYIIAVLIALLAPAPGTAVASLTVGSFHIVQTINIIIVFIISGLTLNTKDMGRAVRQWPGILWGFATILAVTPCLGFALNAIPFTPPEFATGLAVFSAAPTTLGVGAALVRQAKGNDALALLLLTATNALAVFTLPLWLKALIGEGGVSSNGATYSLNFSLGKMVWQLTLTVLAPAVIGKLLRDLCAPVRSFAVKYKEWLSMFAVLNLAFIIWQTLSAAAPLLLAQQFVDILFVIIAAVLQHAIYLVFNTAVIWSVLRMKIEEGVAVTIMGSQKSAPVAVTAISYLTSDVSTQGLLNVPCIVGQLVQIFMGAAIVPWVAQRVEKVQAARQKSDVEAAAAVQNGEENGVGEEAEKAVSGQESSDEGRSSDSAVVNGKKEASPLQESGDDKTTR